MADSFIPHTSGDLLATSKETKTIDGESRVVHSTRIQDTDVNPSNILVAHLRDAANSDTNDMHVNGSVTPAKYEYTVPANKVACIRHATIKIIDGPGSITITEFGAQSALANGLLVQVIDTNGTISSSVIRWMDVERPVYSRKQKY